MIERVAGIEALFDLPEVGDDARAEHALVKLRADDAVAMLAGMRAFILAHHREGFLGDGAHRFDVLLELQVQDRTHMQAAFARMRIHGAAGAMFGEHGIEPFGVVGEMGQGDRTVLDKGDGLALLLHRHHDVEAGGAEIRNRGLRRGLDDIDHAAPFALVVGPREAEVAHQLGKLLQLVQVLRLVFLGEFDDQKRIGVALDGGLDHRTEHRDVAAERNHGAIDQLHGDRPQLHQMLGCIHRLVEAAEVADAEHLVPDHRPQLQLNASW